MERDAEDHHYDRGRARSALGHEAKIGEHQTKLEAKDTGDVAVGWLEPEGQGDLCCCLTMVLPCIVSALVSDVAIAVMDAAHQSKVVYVLRWHIDQML